VTTSSGPEDVNQLTAATTGRYILSPIHPRLIWLSYNSYEAYMHLLCVLTTCFHPATSVYIQVPQVKDISTI